MFYKSPIESKLDAEIISLLNKLKETTKDTKEYADLIDRMATLHKLKTEERLNLPSMDTALVVAANIFGILWLTRFEKENVVTAKTALGFIMRPR